MPEIFGAYDIESLIGRGGMAVVHKARVTRGPNAGRLVALKRLLPDLARDASFVELFLREASVTSHLKHPTIVEVVDVGVQHGVHYIAMDFVDGKDLGQILRQCAERKIHLPVDFCLYVAHVVAQALHVAHVAKDRNGQPLDIVHCDVTPSNVFVSSLGEIRLGDFGVAKTGKNNELTDRFAGKANYAAPEQIEGLPPIPATDVFALGAVLYEMLTNTKAFPGDDPANVFRVILEEDAVPPSRHRKGLRPEVEELVLRALAVRVERGQDTAWQKLASVLGRRRATRFSEAQSFAAALAPLYDPNIGTPLAIAAVVRGLFPRT